jgi:hypothetical protein
MIIGSNNQLVGSLPNSVLIGSQIPMRVSNMTNIANTFNQYINIRDGGIDTVMNPFATTTNVNIIDRGVDNVRPIGGYVLTQISDGGVDFTL